MTTRIPFSTIKRTTASVAGVSIEAMDGQTRKRPVAYSRHVAMWMAKRCTKLSYSDIGNRFGGRDHATVIYACRKVEADIKRGRPRGLLALDVEAVLLGQ
jgi:chromosomal replication initiator protein